MTRKILMTSLILTLPVLYGGRTESASRQLHHSARATTDVELPSIESIVITKMEEWATNRKRGHEIGCGIATMRVRTSAGFVRISCGTHQVNMFGSQVEAGDLIGLLALRIKSTHAGQGPLHQDPDHLCYCVLRLLAGLPEPCALHVLAQMLHDPQPELTGYAAIALIQMAKDERCKHGVESIRFPQTALNQAQSSGQMIPTWVQIEALNTELPIKRGAH